MFKKELDMQKLFISQLNSELNGNEIVHEEFNGRFGNADVVKVILNNFSKLSQEQINILKNYQNAKIVGYLHKRQAHNIQYLMEKTCYTYDSICSSLSKLKKTNIVEIVDDNQYIINNNFEFPNLEFVSFELKLTNWKNAITQAIKNKNFASYSYIAVPMCLAEKLGKTQIELFKLYNVGLVGIDEKKYSTFFKPKVEKNSTSKNPTYISSLAKIIFKEKELT